MEGSRFALYGQIKKDKPLELEPIIVEIANAKQPQVVTQDLDDTKKRWLVVGICLHSVVAPALREYVSKSMNQVFNTLKQSHNIDIQCYPNHPKCYPVAVNLNYEAINNNTIFRSGRNKNQNYDYKIQNSVEFSKLFLSTNMAKYTGFDETCDSSALLNIIMCSDRSKLGQLADQLRMEVRNPWAHCNFIEWEYTKYLASMQLMQQLIRQLHMPSEVKVLAELSHWEVNGINFLQGTRLGLEIVEEVNKHTQSLAKYVLQLKSETSSYSEMVHSSLVLISNEMSNVCKHIDQTDRDLLIITSEVGSLRLQTDNIEKTVNENIKEIKDIKVDIENIKRYNSHQRPNGKVFFYPPDRVSVFVGREDKLLSLSRIKMLTTEK